MFLSRDISVTKKMKSFFIYSGTIAGFFIAFLFTPVPAALAATNINSSAAQHSAWNDEVGWIDFYTTGNVNVISSQLQGYASSSAGAIALDCATSPSGSCAINYDVNNDGAGNLSGWAWNDEVGWISFYWGNASANPTAGTTALCQSYNGYCGVTIDSTGVFHGWAWNDTVGWISFNCADTSCGSLSFDVATAWVAQPKTGTLDSQTFDTGVAGGAQLNSITWKGNVPSGTSVGFQIAVSANSSGPWNFVGPDGTSGTIYAGSGITGALIPLSNYASLIGRYFRYRVILSTNTGQTATPQVTSVVVNWSP
jgi:hypothetical protein